MTTDEKIDELLKAVNEMKTDLRLAVQQQDQHTKHIERIDNTVHNPEKGLVLRVATIEHAQSRIHWWSGLLTTAFLGAVIKWAVESFGGKAGG